MAGEHARAQFGGERHDGHSDVVDITPLRTKILEIGHTTEDEAGPSWVRGRQLTGRIVAVSNKKTFTEPVFNFSANFDFVWEEMSVPSHGDDWERVREIVLEVVRRASASQSATKAIEQMTRRYHVPRTEVEPRVGDHL